MDILEGLLERFRRKEEKGSSEANKLPKDVWSYEIFRQYLLALARKHVDHKTSIPLTEGLISYRNPEFILPINEYPKEIELSGDWHSILNEIRKDSLDGIERFSIIGTKDGERGVYIQAMSAQGLPDRVPAEVIAAELQKARGIYHITTILGDIHSHPRGLLEGMWGKFSPEDRGRFSAGDLYRMVIPNSSIQMMAVVEGGDNIFVFRTKQSTDTGVSDQFFNQNSFEKYWYEQNGFRYLGPAEKFGSRRASPISPTASGWNVNIGIAQRHNLVIYRGFAGRNLVREFPVVSGKNR